MPLLLPSDHPARPVLAGHAVTCLTAAEAEQRASSPLRIGVLNLMPTAEQYEPMLLSPLGQSEHLVEPVWLRLDSHAYASSDLSHLERFYRSAESVLTHERIDGLVLTGAPVEELAFSSVRYWRELSTLLDVADERVRSTLGLCWGGMALAHRLGIEKQPLPQKLFGVHALHPVTLERGRFVNGAHGFDCAQSRHAGIPDHVLEEAARRERVRLLAHSLEAGYSIFESPDQRSLVHLGHPEYTPARLRFEYLRDRQLGREDVAPPVGVSLWSADTRVLPHGPSFFAAWLRQAAGQHG